MTGLLTLAFAAGLLAPINPCGFALLPAYLATQAGTAPGSDRPASARLWHGLRSGIGVSLGFAATLSVAALALALGARPLIHLAPWLAIGVGAVLTVLGLVMLVTGKGVGLRMPGIGNRSQRSARTLTGAITFGVGYALASLACTVGVLLAVVAQATAAANITSLIVVIAAYGAGAATLLITVSLAAALAGTAIAPVTRTLARYSGRIIGALLTATGIYLIAYWLPQATSGGAATGASGPLSTVATVTQNWVSNNVPLVTAAALALISAAVITGWLAHRKATSAPDDCCPPPAAAHLNSPATPAFFGKGPQQP